MEKILQILVPVAILGILAFLALRASRSLRSHTQSRHQVVLGRTFASTEAGNKTVTLGE